MGFGGSVAAMLATLKNNKRERTSTFELMKDGNSRKKTLLHFKNKASKRDLAKIQERLQKENRKVFRRNMLIFIVALTILLFSISYFKF